MKKTYYELQITPIGEYDRFADFILTLTNEAIEECDGVIIVRSEDDLDTIEFGVKVFAESLAASLNQDISVTTKLEEKPNIDWISSYQNSVQPIVVGKFYIHPSWIEPKKDKLNILIDPALSFGSGHHETTYGCLVMLQKYLQKNDKVLDVGCGSGILSIASSKLEAVVDLCDTDELAVKSAKENFKLNKERFHSSWLGSVQKSEAQYDVVIANIIADVLIMLASDLINTTKKEGILILSGILDKYIDRVEKRYSSLEVLEKYKKDEWYTLVLKR
ncbi:50S ribosomal protein L11 methyltransferase [Sulfurospirillum arcachonense]|uniref:50S ribosomal protein L11 methyltransferase n=1 Tax=Sulfurospirillum arcachonense TaxID=57666 RepID=UPI000469A7C3|nr:50S ribosomal protein L11 methyltransferase [Sulfurospirillum arcachonense]